MAIQASRLSTYLHFCSVPGVLPHKMRQHWPNPCVTFFSSGKTSMCDMEYVAPKWPCTTSLYHCCKCVVSPRGELQISTGAAHAGDSRALGFSLRHLAAPGQGGADLGSLRRLLPVCCFAAGKPTGVVLYLSSTETFPITPTPLEHSVHCGPCSCHAGVG